MNLITLQQLVLGGIALCAHEEDHISLLSPEDFPHYVDEWEALKASVKERGTCAPETYLMIHGKIDSDLAETFQGGATAYSLPNWIASLKQSAFSFQAQGVAKKLAAAATEENHPEVESLLTELHAMTPPSTKPQENVSGGELALSWSEMMEARRKHGRVRTGFTGLDSLLDGGLTYGEFMVVGARTGIGKSSFLYQMAESMAVQQGKRVGFFSLEVAQEEVTNLIAKSHCRWDYNTTEKELGDAVFKVSQHPLWINDRVRTLEDFLAQAGHLIRKEKVEILLLDYTQKLGLRQSHQSGYERVAIITDKLKTLTLDHRIVLVGAAQINRAGAQVIGQNKDPGPPALHHLRDSGTLESDANQVVLIHRPPYYCEEARRRNPEEAHVYLRKNRRGRQGHLEMRWAGTCQRLESDGGAF